MSYRDDLEALEQRCAALENDVSAAAKDLAEARRLLAEAQQRRRLPVLDNLHIAAPCSADWAKMTGDDRTRFCASCEKNVYDLSSMTRAAAEALLIEKEGKLCVRFFQRADGTILTADCPDGLQRRRRRRRVVAAAFGAMSAVAAAGAALGGRTTVTMGAPPVRLTGEVQIEVAPPTLKMGDPAPVKMGEVLVTETMGKPAPAPQLKMGRMKVRSTTQK